jgi:hypothetical protein
MKPKKVGYILLGGHPRHCGKFRKRRIGRWGDGYRRSLLTTDEECGILPIGLGILAEASDCERSNKEAVLNCNPRRR